MVRNPSRGQAAFAGLLAGCAGSWLAAWWLSELPTGELMHVVAGRTTTFWEAVCIVAGSISTGLATALALRWVVMRVRDLPGRIALGTVGTALWLTGGVYLALTSLFALIGIAAEPALIVLSADGTTLMISRNDFTFSGGPAFDYYDQLDGWTWVQRRETVMVHPDHGSCSLQAATSRLTVTCAGGVQELSRG